MLEREGYFGIAVSVSPSVWIVSEQYRWYLSAVCNKLGMMIHHHELEFFVFFLHFFIFSWPVLQ